MPKKNARQYKSSQILRTKWTKILIAFANILVFVQFSVIKFLFEHNLAYALHFI